MKRNFKRFLSIWTAVFMLFNMVPVDVFAAEAVYENGLMVQLPDGALTPEQVLGDGYEYGVVAHRYEQTGHTETNFAVWEYSQSYSDSIEIVGSGDNPIPFYVGKLTDGSRLWNGQDTNVDFDVFINENQSGKGAPANSTPPHVQYSNVGNGRPNKETNVYPRTEQSIKDRVIIKNQM